MVVCMHAIITYIHTYFGRWAKKNKLDVEVVLYTCMHKFVIKVDSVRGTRGFRFFLWTDTKFRYVCMHSHIFMCPGTRYRVKYTIQTLLNLCNNLTCSRTIDYLFIL